MRDSETFYRDLVIALWHPAVDRPIDYLARYHQREGWA